jgi:molecular chaperone Hsp33
LFPLTSYHFKRSPRPRFLSTETKSAGSSSSSNVLENEQTLKHKDILARRRTRDHILRASTEDLLIAIINNTNTTATARKRHNLSNLATKLLGRAMAGAAILASYLKGEERVILSFKGQGPMSLVYAEASRCGEVRGYVSHPRLEMPATTPLGYAMRAGTLQVSQILYKHAKPYESVVDLAEADITSDLENYFKMSDQIPAYVELETVLAPGSGDVVFAGGFIIQALPSRDGRDTQAIINSVRERISKLSPPSVLFTEETKSLRELLDILSYPEKVDDQYITKILVDFYCRCSKGRFAEKLVALGEDGMNRLEKEIDPIKGFITTCQYCNAQYTFSPEEIALIRKEALSKKESSREESPSKSTI